MVLIRADGNPTIGTGHIMRCLSLADAFEDAGQRVIFVTADDCAKNIIEQRGYECTVLNSSYDRLEDELPILLPRLETLHPRCVLLDSYFVTPGYMAAVRQKSPLVYIDDQNMFDYPAELVINYMLYADRFVYPNNKRYLLGPQYAPLRREFQGVPKRTGFGPVRNVLVSAGGADPEHVALGCVRYLREQKAADSITYHIVLGAMNPDVAAIESLADGQAQIVLHRQAADMCPLMLRCDAAISAGGTTLFELCACGLPTVTYTLADNQIMNAKSFEDAGLMLNAGDVRKDRLFAGRLFQALDALIDDPLLRQGMSERMQAKLDGRGAERLAAEICDIL